MQVGSRVQFRHRPVQLVGYVGIVSAMSAVGVVDLRSKQGVDSLLAALVGGFALRCALGSDRWVDGRVGRLIGWVIMRWTTSTSWNLVDLLRLRDEYGVSRFPLSGVFSRK